MKGDTANRNCDFLWELAWWRHDEGLSQGDLAQKSGVSRKQISRYETCKVKPHPSTVKRLAAALNCRVKDLFSREIES